jgi:hypothetical protein
MSKYHNGRTGLRRLAAGITFGAFLFVAGTPVLLADDCQKKIIHADHELHKAAEKHGWNSPEAEKWRGELNAARSWCWDHGHRWWDEDAHQWRTEHWDEHDHMHG